jgi:hypothetical protein
VIAVYLSNDCILVPIKRSMDLVADYSTQTCTGNYHTSTSIFLLLLGTVIAMLTSYHWHMSKMQATKLQCNQGKCYCRAVLYQKTFVLFSDVLTHNSRITTSATLRQYYAITTSEETQCTPILFLPTNQSMQRPTSSELNTHRSYHGC